MLVAGSALLVAAAATFIPRGGSSSSNKSGMGATEIDDSQLGMDDDEMITEALVCEIFDRLFLEMQQVVGALSQQLQQIQMSGQMIPQAQVQKLFKGEFERTLMDRQKKVFADFDVDADCVEEATWEFLANGDEKVQKAVERFQRLYDTVSGERTVGGRPGQAGEGTTRGLEAPSDSEMLPNDKLLQAAEAYFAALTDAMRGLVDKFKGEGKDIRQPAVAQRLQMEFASIANEAGEKALEQMGIGLKQFQSSIEKNASNPQIGRALGMLQMKQQQELVNMGVIPM